MEQPANGGWIKLYRSMKDNGHLQMPDRAFKVFVYALLQVNRKTGAGCQPGEGWITYSMIREDCCDPDKPPWGKATINEALDYLESHDYIKRIQKKQGAAMRVRIINWDKYQSDTGSESEPVSEPLPKPVPEPQPEPKQERGEREEPISSQPSAEKPKRQRTKKLKEEPDKHNVAAKPILERLDKWMKANQTAGISNWGAATKIMAAALKGNGGPAIPAEEIVDAIAWGTKHQHWKKQLLASGPTVVRAVWGDWKTGGKGWQSGNRYQDPIKQTTASGSVYDEEGEDEDDKD